VLRNLFDRIAAHPVWIQTLLYLVLIFAALIVFGVLALLSPFVMVLATFALIVAIFALVVGFLRHRPLRRWGLIAVTSLVLLLVFMGISNALYFNGQPQQANSPNPEKQTSNPNASPESPERPEQHKGVEQLDRKQQEDADKADANAKAQPNVAESDNAKEPQSSVMVKRAVDGDTIEISPSMDGKDTVRLIGIDAPEIKKLGCGPQPLSQEAADRASLWEGQKVRLEFDQERTDKYGRLLAYVHDPMTAQMMNVGMIQSGYAQVYIVPPNTQHVDELRKAQDQAKAASIGFGMDIWSLPLAKDAQLADHGNGIGNGDGACSPEPQPPQSASNSSVSSRASPNPSPNPYAPNLSAPSSASSSASPAARGN
jgi:micrococcal nuclease